MSEVYPYLYFIQKYYLPHAQSIVFDFYMGVTHLGYYPYEFSHMDYYPWVSMDLYHIYQILILQVINRQWSVEK